MDGMFRFFFLEIFKKKYKLHTYIDDLVLGGNFAIGVTMVGSVNLNGNESMTQSKCNLAWGCIPGWLSPETMTAMSAKSKSPMQHP
jgi:hypothetical protein